MEKRRPPLKAETLFNVHGLATLVTGAASGLGLAYARVMAVNGARVLLTDIDEVSLESSRAALADAGCEVDAMRVDVTDKSSIDAAVARAISRFGALDVVFANVGMSGGPGFLKGDGQRNPAGLVESVSLELFQRVMDVNVTSVFKTVQACVPAMKAQGSGRIIVTSSISASYAERYVGSAYVTSKAAVGQMVRQLAFELARYGILVNAIAPGPVVTNIGGGRLKDAQARAPFERAAPLHRIATTEDVQGAALFLASPASRHMTGAQIVIDGGVTLGTAD